MADQPDLEQALAPDHTGGNAAIKSASGCTITGPAAVEAARAAGEATVPTTIALERATNPFMRARSVAQLAERRQAKDNFRG